MRLVFVALSTLLVALLSAGPALAQQPDEQVVAPPGNSGVEEYLEIVPGAGGDRPAGGGGQTEPTPGDARGDRDGPTPRELLGAQTARELRQLGPDGRAAAEVAAASAPPASSVAAGTRDRSQRRSTAERPSNSIDTHSNGGRTEAVVGALSGSGGGMGLAFPLLLLGAVAAAVGLLAARRIARHE